MKKLLTTLLLVLPLLTWADDGSLLWLQPNVRGHNKCIVNTNGDDSPTLKIARQELETFLSGATIQLICDKKLPADDGYQIEAGPKRVGCLVRYNAVITAGTHLGLLYGAYDLIRRNLTGRGTLSASEHPAFAYRLLNHWDNLDGSVERGYAGKSIWKWEDINNGIISPALRERLIVYARANASIGINGTVLNNVNASANILTTAYLNKVKAIVDLLRPYGLRVYLSVNFASPMALGATKTADPLKKDVRRWWKKKAKEIYTLIPDFGGFLVKANSEGQPGPGDYHRTHVQGANMLADALSPYNGLVIWRSFVYGANHKDEDRVKQAVSEFAKFDGKFRKNVILQSKNGPLDFQPREPYAPIFDHMKHTPQMAEFQITQEYTGQSRHLVYLATMWKEFFSFVQPSQLKGIAGVANTGDDANWCGHPFSQANWYAFGRLAWNPSLSAEDIANEWLRQTFHADTAFEHTACRIMMDSRETCVNYMMPLGLHHIFKFDHHFGPEPDGFKAEYPIEWCPVYYHRADSNGVGFDRTVATGSGATAQYRQPYASMYDNINSCPEEYLLWFHHVAWNFRMKSGRTLWQELCYKYHKGVTAVDNYQALWRSDKVKGRIDDELWQHTDSLLTLQCQDARQWESTCLTYFQKFACQPMPSFDTPTINTSAPQ